jgi:hypothetical protein
MSHHVRKYVPYEHNTYLQVDSPEQFQWWYFDAEFEQDYSACLVILPHSMGGGEGEDPNIPESMVWITIATPDGKSVSVKQEYPKAELQTSTTGLDARLGKSSIRFDGKSYLLKFDEGDLAADLTITPVILPWRPGGVDDKMAPEDIRKLGPDADFFFDYVEFMPRGNAEGVLRIKDKTIKVNGLGYHEQGFGNFIVGRLMEEWFWTKHYLGEYTMVLTGATLGEQARARMGDDVGEIQSKMFMLARGDQIIAEVADVTNTVVKLEVLEEMDLPEAEKKIPSKVIMSVDSEDVKVEARTSYKFMRDLVPFEYSAEVYIPKYPPTWLQYVTEMDAKITIGGKTENKKTQGIYEIMFSG